MAQLENSQSPAPSVLDKRGTRLSDRASPALPDQREGAEAEKRAVQERAEELALANESLAHVVGLLHAVGRFAEMVLASRDFSLLGEALAILGAAAAADRVWTFRIQKSPSAAILDQSWVASHISQLPNELCFLEGDVPEMFAPLRRGEAYQGHPETREGVNAELNQQFQTLSDLILPIMVDGELWGAIGFDDCHNMRSWSEEEIRVLKSAAATIAAAIERQQAEREAQEAIAQEREKAATERATELTKANDALQATADAIATLRALDEIVPAILKIIARTFKGPSAAYYEIGSDSTIYLRYYINEGSVISGAELLAGDGTPPYDLPKILAAGFKVSRDYSGADDYRKLKTRVIDHRRGTSEPIFDNWRRKHNREMELNIPLMMGGEPLGVLTLSREAERPYTDAEIELAEAVVKQFCVAVQASRIAEDASHKAVAIAIAREQETAAQTSAAEMARANDELALRNRLLSVVADVSTRLARIGDISASLHEALKTIGVAAQFSRVLVLEERQRPSPQEGSDHFVIAEWCAPGIESHVDCGTTVIPSEAAEAFLNILRAGQAFWCRVEDVAYPMRDTCERMEVKATGCAPLMVDGAYWGNVAFDDCVRPEPWDTAHVDALTAIAQAISNALQTRRDAERVALEREVAAKQRADELSAVNETITASFRRIATQSDTVSAPPVFLSDIARAAGAELCYWLDYDAVTDQLALSLRCKNGAIIERPEPDEPEIFSSPFPAGLMAESFVPASENQFNILSVDRDSDRLWPATAAWHRQAGRKQVLCFAVTLGDRPVGMLAMAFREETDWSVARTELIRSLANHLALSVHLCRLSDQASRGAAMEERTRLAREIHDTLAQGFSGILVQLRALQQAEKAGDGNARMAHFESALELANTGLAEARRSLASLRLRELEGRSFREALSLMAQSATKRGGIPIKVMAGVDLEAGPEIEAELLRIAQESVTNAIKHSGASSIHIALRRGMGTVDLCIEDNGKGFDPHTTTEGFGLLGMQERAARIGATMTIKSSASGTSVCVHLKRGGRDARL